MHTWYISFWSEERCIGEDRLDTACLNRSHKKDFEAPERWCFPSCYRTGSYASMQMGVLNVMFTKDLKTTLAWYFQWTRGFLSPAGACMGCAKAKLSCTVGPQPGVTSLETWKQIQTQERAACQHTGARSEGMPCSKGNPEPSLITKGPGIIYLQISHDIFHVSQQPHSIFLTLKKTKKNPNPQPPPIYIHIYIHTLQLFQE